MFHFEETVGVLSLLPNMALVKLPCMAIKVYMFCFLQQSVLLLVSVLWDVILNGVKTYKIISHVRTARKYKNWLADSERSDMTLSAKTVREKLLKKHFFFQESPKTGKLEDPGLTLGLLWYMFGEICWGNVPLPALESSDVLHWPRGKFSAFVLQRQVDSKSATEALFFSLMGMQKHARSLFVPWRSIYLIQSKLNFYLI